MTALISAPRRGVVFPPPAAPRGVPRRRNAAPGGGAVSPGRAPRRRTVSEDARGLPRPRGSTFGRVLRGVSLLLGIALLLALAAAGGLLQVQQSARTAEAGYELRALQAERAQLGARLRLLEAEIAYLADLEAVYADATERLGMVPSERSVNLAVGVPAPTVIPMPERYVQQVAPLPAEDLEWWERLLGRLSGFD